ncbi:hypothetical protein, partial [Acinetobacter baumannii]|uniref:hypothetical protein n=1 Tax=Acinetobacter baumannii TaxID=470 RepID=UPI001BB46BFD
ESCLALSELCVFWFKTVRVCQKTPIVFSPSTSKIISKSSYIAAEVPTQSLQSEHAKKIKHP